MEIQLDLFIITCSMHEKMRNSYRIFAWNIRRVGSKSDRLAFKWEGNIKVNVKEIAVNRTKIKVTHCGIQWRAYMVTAMSQGFSDKSQGYSSVSEAVVWDCNPPRTCHCIWDIFPALFDMLISFSSCLPIFPMWWCIKRDRPSARS